MIRRDLFKGTGIYYKHVNDDFAIFLDKQKNYYGMIPEIIAPATMLGTMTILLNMLGLPKRKSTSKDKNVVLVKELRFCLQ